MVNTLPQRILITGGTGFIGTALCRTLLKQGHTLTLFSRSPAKVRSLFGESVACVREFDALGPDAVFDAVINLSGEPVVGPRWSAARKATLLASRAGVTDALVRWMGTAQQAPKRLISGSAIGYYGIQQRNDSRALTEADPSQDIFMSTLCQTWERSAQAATAKGVSVSIIRLGVVLGPVAGGHGALPPMLLPVRLGLNGQLGDGQQVISWVHRDDVIRAILHLLELPPEQASGAFNLTAPEPARQGVLIRAAAQALGRRLTLPLPAPAPVLKLLLGEQASLLLEGQRVVPRRLLDSGFVFQYAEVGQALRDCVKA